MSITSRYIKEWDDLAILSRNLEIENELNT